MIMIMTMMMTALHYIFSLSQTPNNLKGGAQRVVRWDPEGRLTYARWDRLSHIWG